MIPASGDIELGSQGPLVTLLRGSPIVPVGSLLGQHRPDLPCLSF